MCNSLIRVISTLSFNRKDVYHGEIFKTPIFHDVLKLNISQRWTFFLMEYDFHTSQMKACMFDCLIHEVWKSSINWKDIYYREIFKMPIFHHVSKLNISQWWTFFWWSMTYILHKWKDACLILSLAKHENRALIGRMFIIAKYLKCQFFMTCQN